VALDISDRKQSEAEVRRARDALRELSLRHEDRLNEERRRLSLEVHDHLGQMLTALKLQLDIMDPHLGSDPVLRAAAARMRSLTEEVVEVVRNVAMNLRPPALDLGLAPALEWLVEDFGLRWEIDVAVLCTLDDSHLSDLQATALFRIAQEALTNVARHAHARHVRIYVSPVPDGTRMVIEDDGVGFDAQAVRRRGSLGLLGMKERTLQLGGRFDVSSQSGAGSRLEVRIPKDEEDSP
jgi:signal transduction histidine kinase